MATCTYNDCLKAPIPEKCFYFCIYQILLKANPQDKVSVLRFSHSTAESIFAAYNTFRASNYEELFQHLSAAEINETLGIFRNITQAQLNYFANK